MGVTDVKQVETFSDGKFFLFVVYECGDHVSIETRSSCIGDAMGIAVSFDYETGYLKRLL